MEEELQALRDELRQMKAANERLVQEQADSQPASNMAMSGPSGPTDETGNVSRPPSVNVVTERVMYIPKERKCPVFRGYHGIGIRVGRRSPGMYACTLFNPH